jgi:hypothetical protein
MRIKTSIFIMLVCLVLGACQPNTGGGGTTTTTIKPMSEFTWLFGASTEAQLYNSGIVNDNREWYVANGYGLSQWDAEVDWAIGSTPQTIIFTSGLAVNNAATWKGDGGWTQTDTGYWYGKLDLMDPRTCAIVTLPAVSEAVEATYPGLGAQVDKARAALSAIDRANTVIIDLQSIMQDDDFADGIHFSNMGVVQEYYDLINWAESQC